MNNQILFRKSGFEDEFKIASKYFPCIERRTEVLPNNLVIARYSALPFYKELEEDVETLGSKLINSFHQHQYISDLGNWANDLGDLTPKTWHRLEDIPEKGPFVVKGATNSKKFEWQTKMFAVDKRAAIDVACQLMNDGVIGEQKIYVRQYIPLVKFIDGIQGMPVTEEYRIFTCDGEILSSGY